MDSNEWQVVGKKKKEPKLHSPPDIFKPNTRPIKPQTYPKKPTLPKTLVDANNSLEKKLEQHTTIIDTTSDNPDPLITNQIDTPLPPSIDINLTHKYIMWVHSIHENDWSISGYKQICAITNVSDFWRLFNNLSKLNYKNNNFYLMKPNVDPIWEHDSNRYGGICSLRIEMDYALKVYELLCIFLMCEKLVTDMADINGISITPKNNWAILKIWNKDKNNKIDKLLHKSILDKYKNVSIQYKQNQPEY